MQLEKYVRELEKEIGVEVSFATATPGVYEIPLEEGTDVKLSVLPEGFLLSCEVIEVPSERLEAFYTEAMLANLLGQGTKGAVLGLNLAGNLLTLTRAVEYNVDYKDFKELVEDFLNTVDFWRDEVLRHNNMQK